MINFLLYFVVGFLLDMFSTLDIQAVQKDQAYKSAAVSFIGTLLSYYIFYNIIISPDYLLGIFSYALGGAVGTVLTMRCSAIKMFFIKILPQKYAVAGIRNDIPKEAGNN